jgi:uncharacterized membrane protein YdfJ with MMPL/SSD domain
MQRLDRFLGRHRRAVLAETLVRLVLVPSTMQLLGERNWWQPFRRGPSGASPRGFSPA